MFCCGFGNSFLKDFSFKLKQWHAFIYCIWHFTHFTKVCKYPSDLNDGYFVHHEKANFKLKPHVRKVLVICLSKIKLHIFSDYNYISIPNNEENYEKYHPKY